MARFTFNGIDSLDAEFDKLTSVSDDVMYGILEAGAEVLKTSQQRVLRRLGLMDPKVPQLINSLTVTRITRHENPAVQLRPTGKRKNKKNSYTRHKKISDGSNRRHSSGSYANTNEEVGYMLEYGTPRMPAKHWMEKGNEEGIDGCVAAEEAAWNKYLTENGF